MSRFYITHCHGPSLLSMRQLYVLFFFFFFNTHTDVPEPVVVTANVKDDEVTLKWRKPEDNGAVITQYSIYQRSANDEQWTRVAVINDISKLEYNVKVEKGKDCEFVVTATNKYGESLKNRGRIKILVALGGTLLQMM